MNIENYHHLVKELGEDVRNFDRSILEALDNEQPSVWIPEVRKSLFEFYKKFPDFERSDEVLTLYTQGEAFQFRKNTKELILVGAVCFILGTIIGFLI